MPFLSFGTSNITREGDILYFIVMTASILRYLVSLVNEMLPKEGVLINHLFFLDLSWNFTSFT